VSAKGLEPLTNGLKGQGIGYAHSHPKDCHFAIVHWTDGKKVSWMQLLRWVNSFFDKIDNADVFILA